jgi:hypothetical protein
MYARIIALAALAAVATALPTSQSQATFAYPDRLAALDPKAETGCYPKRQATAAIHSLQNETDNTRANLAAKMNDEKEAFETHKNEVKQALLDEMQELEEQTTKDLEALETELTETKEALEGQVEKAIANLTKAVADSLGNYQQIKTAGMANDTGSFKWSKNYALVAAAQAPGNTENGHAGRMMYKIEYNPNNPGYFHPGSPELKTGCTSLSEDLKSIDNIDRALKPAADVDWASDGDSVRLQGSYLSNCGCGGHPRQRQCVGMSKNFLAGGVMYNRYNSWWGCRLLRNDGRDCHHHWSDCYGRWGVKGIFTICTSSNENHKV